MKIDMNIKITDIIFYTVIVVMLCFYIKVTMERVETQRVNIELRLRDCNIPTEYQTIVVNEIVNEDYDNLNNLTNYTDPNTIINTGLFNMRGELNE